MQLDDKIKEIELEIDKLHNVNFGIKLQININYGFKSGVFGDTKNLMNIHIKNKEKLSELYKHKDFLIISKKRVEKIEQIKNKINEKHI